MKKSGFTLIELLGVIVILSILSLITIPIIDRSLNQGKENLSDIQKGQLIKALKNYYTEHLSEFNAIGEGSDCKTVAQLKENGYLPTDLKDPKTNLDLSEDIEVCVRKELNCHNDGYKDICSFNASYSLKES